MKSTTKVRVVKTVTRTTVTVTTTERVSVRREETRVSDEAEVMSRYRLYKPAVLPCEYRNALILRNYRELHRVIGRSPYARSLGDEAASIINELLTVTARTFDPAVYTNPVTRRRFTAADVGDEGLDGCFRGYCKRAISTALGRAVQKRRREAATDFQGDAVPLYGREPCPSFVAEMHERAGCFAM
jgi:hypothetical protein